jgi:phosphatidylcholine synthase
MATQGARAAAVAVHVYTSIGVALALLMVHFSYEGDVEAVLWLFLVAMVVDGTDGMLARRLHVKTVVPNFDGALLDNIVDYITYAFAPMVLLWSNGYLPDGAWGGVVAAIPLLASCYQFCRIDAKTEDHFFLGFPSYWNVVAFYAIVCSFGSEVTTVVLLVFAVLVFVPVKYLYPSRTEKLWYANMALSAVWLGLFAVITALMPDPPTALVVLSLGYVVYYVAVSLWLTFASPAQRAQRASAGQGRATGGG